MMGTCPDSKYTEIIENFLTMTGTISYECVQV